MRLALVGLVVVVAAVASGCGSSPPSAAGSSSSEEITPTPAASPSTPLVAVGYCADLAAGDVFSALRHVHKGDMLNTGLVKQLAHIQAWMLTDAASASNPKAAAAIRTAASRMGRLANGVGGTPDYAHDSLVKLEAQAARLTALSAALASAC